MRIRAVVSSVLLFIAQSLWAAEGGVSECGRLENAFGPFDYRDPSLRGPGGPILTVEPYHFSLKVQTLASGDTTSYGPGPDLDYTLRAFPNHHRALYVMVNYYTDAVSKTRPPMPYTARCYFDRATRFQPDDATVWMLYGIYLDRMKLRKEALEKLLYANKLAPEQPEIHYNLGLVQLALKNYEAAKLHAEAAYAANYPLRGLMKKLQKLGYWDGR